MRRCLSSGSPGRCPLYYRTGKLHNGFGCRQTDHVHYHDAFLCPALLCLAFPVSGRRSEGNVSGCMAACPVTNRSVPDAAEHLDQCGAASFLGDFTQYPIYISRCSYRSAVLPNRQRNERQTLSLSPACRGAYQKRKSRIPCSISTSRLAQISLVLSRSTFRSSFSITSRPFALVSGEA